MDVEPLADHVLRYRFIILDLGPVAAEQRLGYGGDLRLAATLEKLPQRHRMVDVRHPHLTLDEVAETFVGFRSSRHGRPQYLQKGQRTPTLVAHRPRRGGAFQQPSCITPRTLPQRGGNGG